jgi:thiamine biosynthesis lipoprotein
MNTSIVVEGTTRDLLPWFRRVEATLTRFDPASPLSQLNRRQGTWTVVPPLLFRAIREALAAAHLTGGAFDPTLLDALEAAGYSRSFELGPGPVGAAPGARQPARWREIRLESATRAVWLPPGVRLDLGGIGKGLAVDGALAQLREEPRAVVNAGGDLALKTASGDGPVLVEVADPNTPSRVLAAFALRSGAVATSSILGRRWGRGMHHIIDPATGRPSASGVVAATVFGDRAARAEVLAKAAIVLGPERGLSLVQSTGCLGLLVLGDGTVLTTPGLEGFRDGPA